MSGLGGGWGGERMRRWCRFRGVNNRSEDDIRPADGPWQLVATATCPTRQPPRSIPPSPLDDRRQPGHRHNIQLPRATRAWSTSVARGGPRDLGQLQAVHRPPPPSRLLEPPLASITVTRAPPTGKGNTLQDVATGTFSTARTRY